MSIASRVSSYCDFRSGNESARLRFQPTDSNNSIRLDPDQVAFKSSSQVLLRAREKGDEFYQNDAYINGARRVVDFMYNIWQNGQLCDVVIQVQGGEVHAHKIALGAYSDVLTERFTEFPPGEVVCIDLNDFRLDIVSRLVNFLYTISIDITDNTVGQLHACATATGIEVIVRMCKEYLGNFNVENAVLYYCIAEKRNIQEVQSRLLSFICRHFHEIINNRHFGSLPFEKLSNLLADDRLALSAELDVFYAVLTWVDHNRIERLPLAPLLLRCVRFHLISPEELVSQVEPVDWIFLTRECHNMIYEALKYHALHLSGSRLSPAASPHRTGRVATHFAPHTTTATGYNAPFTPTNKSYAGYKASPVAAGYTVPSTPAPVGYSTPKPTTVGYNTPMPPKAGYNTPRPSARVEYSLPMPSPTAYSPRARSRSTSPPRRMLSPRIVSPPPRPVTPPPRVASPTTDEGRVQELRDQFSAEAMGRVAGPRGSLTMRYHVDPPEPQHKPKQLLAIAVGGIDLQSIDDTVPGKCVLKLDTETNSWNNFSKLREYTHHHGVAVLQNCLFVIGGALYDSRFPDRLGRATNAVHVLDPATMTWSEAPPMKEKRSYHSVAVYEESIYVVGGEDDEKRKLDSIERYDLESNSWSYVARMASGAKIGVATAVYNDQLFTVGGFNKDNPGQSVLADVESFDLLQQRWVRRKPLSIARCHANLVEVMGCLYLIGGRTKIHEPKPTLRSLSFIEVYNEALDIWEYVNEMKVARHDAGCTAVGGKLYIVGGMMSPSPFCLESVECLDMTTNSWLRTENLPYAAAGVTCCALVL